MIQSAVNIKTTEITGPGAHLRSWNKERMRRYGDVSNVRYPSVPVVHVTVYDSYSIDINTYEIYIHTCTCLIAYVLIYINICTRHTVWTHLCILVNTPFSLT